jgi:hypothetical protein
VPEQATSKSIAGSVDLEPAGYCTCVQGPPDDRDAAEPVEYVVARIKDVLAHDGRVAALDVDVHVADNTVVLEGSVPTEERRRACTELVHTVLPDCTVENRLVVVHADAPSTIEDVT